MKACLDINKKILEKYIGDNKNYAKAYLTYDGDLITTDDSKKHCSIFNFYKNKKQFSEKDYELYLMHRTIFYEYLCGKTNELNMKNTEDIFEHIYRFSGISESTKDIREVIAIISVILDRYLTNDKIKNDFYNLFKSYISKKLKSLDKDDVQYANEYRKLKNAEISIELMRNLQ